MGAGGRTLRRGLTLFLPKTEVSTPTLIRVYPRVCTGLYIPRWCIPRVCTGLYIPGGVYPGCVPGCIPPYIYPGCVPGCIPPYTPPYTLPGTPSTLPVTVLHSRCATWGARRGCPGLIPGIYHGWEPLSREPAFLPVREGMALRRVLLRLPEEKDRMIG